MFLGEFRHTLDEKSRITLPAKYRTQLAAGIVLTAGLDRCILVFPKDEFENLTGKVNQLQYFGHDESMLRRLIYKNASDAELDKQGRVVIPENLRSYAGITGEVVIVGVGKFIEMWAPQEWAQAEAEVRESASQGSVWAKLGI